MPVVTVRSVYDVREVLQPAISKQSPLQTGYEESPALSRPGSKCCCDLVTAGATDHIAHTAGSKHLGAAPRNPYGPSTIPAHRLLRQPSNPPPLRPPLRHGCAGRSFAPRCGATARSHSCCGHGGGRLSGVGAAALSGMVHAPTASAGEREENGIRQCAPSG